MRLACSILCLLITLPVAANAHDLIQPDWRGLEGTTLQEWRFDSLSNPALPEAIHNPYGDATAEITVGEFGTGWADQIPGFGTETGIWDLGSEGTIVIDIDNRPLQLEYKEIWIQTTYYEDSLIPAPLIEVPGAINLSDQTEVVVVEHTDPFGDWLLQKSVWRIYPNPLYEQIRIIASQSGGMVSQVVVDTICIPEPASVILLSLGSLAVFKKKR